MIRYYLGAGSVALALLVASCLEFQPPAHPPEVQAILDAILANLNAVGTLTGDLSVVDSTGIHSCTDGWLAMKGTDKTFIDFGSTNQASWHDAEAVNYTHNSHITLSNPSGLSGNRKSDWSYCFYGWCDEVGAFDLRLLHAFAAQDATLAHASGTEVIGGATCNRLNGDALRIWVDAANPGRVIRLEVWVPPPGAPAPPELVYRTTFTGWQPLAGGGEAPASWVCENRGTYTITYVLTSAVAGAAVSDEVFATWDPGPVED